MSQKKIGGQYTYLIEARCRIVLSQTHRRPLSQSVRRKAGTFKTVIFPKQVLCGYMLHVVEILSCGMFLQPDGLISRHETLEVAMNHNRPYCFPEKKDCFQHVHCSYHWLLWPEIRCINSEWTSHQSWLSGWEKSKRQSRVALNKWDSGISNPW